MFLKNTPKIAIVCDWLTVQGGAEQVIFRLHQLFPQAEIYTSLYNPQKLPQFKTAKIHTSFLQRIPYFHNKHQLLLGLMPYAFENFNLSKYDIIISSSHSCAKGIITKPQTIHISYCHSPTRYAWEFSNQYIKQYELNPILKPFIKSFITELRKWDFLASKRVDHYIANSKLVQKRIQKYYKQPSTVIYPGINTSSFTFSEKKSQNYLAVGRLTAYKKFDLLIEAFNQNGKPLNLIGTGNLFNQLKKKAKPNINFLGFVNDSLLKEHYANSKALIFPQLEDFGLIPLEAQASGTPVIAYKAGGSLETVIDQKTGVFFETQTPESLNQAINNFETQKFSPKFIQSHAKTFDNKHFDTNFLNFFNKLTKT